jgi:hypothetical protein
MTYQGSREVPRVNQVTAALYVWRNHRALRRIGPEATERARLKLLEELSAAGKEAELELARLGYR